MKILHTADWHIGKVLHKHSLEDEMQLFFEWLLDTIEAEKVDLLLVSGDIFDIANPSANDRKTYYQVLTKLAAMQIRVIITGGNHDSIGVLNAPKEILNAINIDVVGGATQPITDELILLEHEPDGQSLVVAAVPFLRDKDLRSLSTDKAFDSRTQAIRAGITAHYKTLHEASESLYPGIPTLAMGHLFAIGSLTSESERDIHIGNAAAISSEAFGTLFGYVALGHIHRPQVIGNNPLVRYSGSPIPLSFSEKKDTKSVVIVELKNNTFEEPRVIPVPKARELKKISGSYEEVEAKLKVYSPDFPLPSFVELEVKEDAFSNLILSNLESLTEQYRQDSTFKILKSRPIFKTGVKDTSDLFVAGENIEDLSPIDVFKKRIESEEITADQTSQLLNAFTELLEIVQTESI